MSCEWINSVLPLFLYGELSFEEEESVHRHLESCVTCRGALERERALHAALDSAAVEPAPELLVECRSDLRAAIGERPLRRSLWTRLWDWSGRPVSPALLKPAGALALLAVGFFSARLMPPKAQPAPAEVGPVATQVRYLQPDASGRVRIVLDETRERVLSGDLAEAPIQRLVLEAAQDSADPGLRLDSFDLLQPHSDAPQVRQAFLQALQSDPNAGVRLKAVDALRPYGADPQVRSVLANVLLTDQDVAVRSQAIDLLVQRKEMDTVGVLQQLLTRERDSYIRERVERALQDMNASMGAF